jgi:hypothetical protein
MRSIAFYPALLAAIIGRTDHDPEPLMQSTPEDREREKAAESIKVQKALDKRARKAAKHKAQVARTTAQK